MVRKSRRRNYSPPHSKIEQKWPRNTSEDLVPAPIDNYWNLLSLTFTIMLTLSSPTRYFWSDNPDIAVRKTFKMIEMIELTFQFPTIAGRENDTRITRIAIGAICCDSVWYNTAWNAQASMTIILCRNREFCRLWHWSKGKRSEMLGILGRTANKSFRGRKMTRMKITSESG